MNVGALLPTAPLTEIQQAVRDHFQEGGSGTAVSLVLLAIVVIVVLVYCLTQRQRRRDPNVLRCDSEGLFRDLVGKLDVETAQQHWLLTVAKELKLKNPTVLLLSPKRFDDCAVRWQSRSGRGGLAVRASADTELIARMRSWLFPETP